MGGKFDTPATRIRQTSYPPTVDITKLVKTGNVMRIKPLGSLVTSQIATRLYQLLSEQPCSTTWEDLKQLGCACGSAANMGVQRVLIPSSSRLISSWRTAVTWILMHWIDIHAVKSSLQHSRGFLFDLVCAWLGPVAFTKCPNYGPLSTGCRTGEWLCLCLSMYVCVRVCISTSGFQRVKINPSLFSISPTTSVKF